MAELVPSTESPWLAIVGIGADGLGSLSERARAAITHSELVIGSGRQLELVAGLVRGPTLTWPSPLAHGITQLWARRGRPTCVLASGDPFCYGIGATLAPGLRPGEFVCHPAPSSLSLAAARLGWALQDLEVVSLHGRDLHNIVRYLQPRRRVLALSWDERTPAALAALLVQRGFGKTQLHVLEALGGDEERVRSTHASAFALEHIQALNLIALEVVADAGAFALPCRGSLPDDAFEHDGQLTKQDVRAWTLSALAPHAGARLWDIGAGAGSIAIEWLLSHPANTAHAIESDAVRCARIRRNARQLGTPSLQVIEGRAPTSLQDLPTPEVVFIGGGASDPTIFEHVWRVLPSGGRLVINSVTLDTDALLFRQYTDHGGRLCRLSIEHAEPLGSLTGWLPARPVTQWRVTKP